MRAQLVKVFAMIMNATGWLFKSRSLRTLFVKRKFDGLTGKRPVTGVTDTDPRRLRYITVGVARLKNTYCSMAMSVEYRSRFNTINP